MSTLPSPYGNTAPLTLTQPAQRPLYGSTVPTIPDWVNSGRPSAEELNKLTAPRVQVAAANTPIPIIYGRDRQFGRIFFCSVDEAGGFLYLGMLFCEGTIDAFEAVFVDGVDITAPTGLLSFAGAQVNQHLGTSNDTADALLQAGAAFASVGGSNPPPYTDTLPGVAYLALKIPKKASRGFPRVEAVIRGRKVYDPRKDSTNGGSGAHRLATASTWEYSANPTLCYADFAYNRVGWSLDWASVIDNANANDVVLSNGKKRREIGLSLVNPATAGEWLQGFRTYMGAFVSWEGGKQRIIPERADVEATYGLLLNNGKTASPYDYVQAPHNAAVDLGTGNFTLQAQVRFDKTGVGQALVGKYVSGTVAGWYFRLDAGNRLHMHMHDGTSGAGPLSPAITVPTDGELHEVTVMVDRTAGTATFFLDNVQLGNPVAFTLAGSISNTSATVRLGGLGTASNNLFGVLDEVRVWKKLLSTEERAKWRVSEVTPVPAELVAYYKLNSLSGATATDSSATANHATVQGTPSWTLGNPQVIPAGVAFHFTADTLRDGIQLRHRSSRNAPNSILIEYTDSSYTASWRTARVPVDAPKVTAGLAARRQSQINLPGIHDAAQAYREAVERLNWFLSDLEGTIHVFDEGLMVQNGSVIAVTHPMGLNAKLFRVRNLSTNGGHWSLDITEYDPAAYSDAVISTPTLPDTNLGNPLKPPAITGLSCVEELFKYKSGLTGSRVRATWAASSYAFLSGYVIEGYVNGVRVFQTTSLLNEAVTPPVEELVGTSAVTYEVRVAAQTPYAIGAYTTAQTTVLGKLAPPSNVPSLTATQIKSDQVVLKWGEATDIDIWRYEVRRGTTGSTWATATPLDLADGLTYTATGLALGTHVFFVKARDSVGNESPAATSATITLTAPNTVASFSGFEVGGEVRLTWSAPVGSPFVARYRVAYSDVPQTYERTLDVVDTLTFNTKDVAEGTYDFKVYTLDDAGRESAAPVVRRISVTSDQDAFLADSHEYVNPTVTNMATWTLRTEPTKFWVTNMGGAFSSNPSDFSTYSAVPLANYHASGSSSWLSETKDFGLLLTGNWLLESDLAVLSGTATVQLELSRDNVAWDVYPSSPPVSAKGEYRYARVRVTTATTSTVLIKSPTMKLSVKVVPMEETGKATSSATPGTGVKVTLGRDYTAVKEITVTPINSIEPMSGVVDNIQLNVNGGASPSTFDIYVFDRFGQQLAVDVQWKFKGV